MAVPLSPPHIGRRILAAGLLLGLAHSPVAGAGVVMREVQVTESSDEDVSGRRVTEVWAEGAQVKTVFVESANPMTPAGSYLLIPGGDIIYLIDPARKTLARMDMVEIGGIAEKGQAMADEHADATGAKREIAGLKLDKTLDEPGPEMLGFPTRHYRYELSYTEKQHMKGMPGSFDTKIEERHEFWATQALNDEPAIAAIQADRTEFSGDDAPDRVVDEAGARMAAHGFFLRHMIERKSESGMSEAGGMMRMMPGMSESSGERISAEVTELKRLAIAAAEFAVPKGYAETEFFAPGATGMPDLDVLPGQDDEDMPDLDNVPGPGGEGGVMPDLDSLPR